MADQTPTPEKASHAILKLIERSGGARTLPFYRNVGLIVAGCDGGYGSNTRATVAELLDKASVEGLQKENLAKAAKFADTIDSETANALEEKGVSWRNAAMLCSAHIDHKRAELIAGVLNDTIEADQLGHAIKKASGTKSISGRRSIETAADRAKTEILMLAKIAFGRGHSVDEDAKTAAEAMMIDLRNLVTQLIKERRPAIRRGSPSRSS